MRIMRVLFISREREMAKDVCDNKNETFPRSAYRVVVVIVVIQAERNPEKQDDDEMMATDRKRHILRAETRR